MVMKPDWFGEVQQAWLFLSAKLAGAAVDVDAFVAGGG